MSTPPSHCRRRVGFNRDTPTPTAQEDDMPTAADLWNYPIVVGKDANNGGDVRGTAGQLLAQANQQDWFQTNTLKTLVDALAKVTTDPNVSAANVEKWIKDGIAESVKVTGTLTVEPASAPDAPPEAQAPQDAAPACADGNDPHNV